MALTMSSKLEAGKSRLAEVGGGADSASTSVGSGLAEVGGGVYKDHESLTMERDGAQYFTPASTPLIGRLRLAEAEDENNCAIFNEKEKVEECQGAPRRQTKKNFAIFGAPDSPTIYSEYLSSQISLLHGWKMESARIVWSYPQPVGHTGVQQAHRDIHASTEKKVEEVHRNVRSVFHFLKEATAPYCAQLGRGSQTRENMEGPAEGNTWYDLTGSKGAVWVLSGAVVHRGRASGGPGSEPRPMLFSAWSQTGRMGGGNVVGLVKEWHDCA